MIRTLKSYLAWDLLKTTALAAVAFTLVMTFFAVIEPLRERGLSSQQALKLFGFSMPAMVSLTLPVAALFAATMVYGRFAQDNELMASRASGICPLALLSPAAWLGLIVTLATLALGLYVAPRLLWKAQYTVKNNLRHIVFHGLRSRGYIEVGGQIFHADRVDPETGWMEGVVALDVSDRDDVVYLVAAKAKLDFFERDGRTFVSFSPVHYTARRQNGGWIALLEREQIRRGELPDLFQDEPKLYDWGELIRARADPGDLPLVRQEVRRIKQRLCVQVFYQDLAGAIAANGRYGRLEEFGTWGQTERSGWIEIQAGSAKREGKEVLLSSVGPAGARAVLVRQGEGGQPLRSYAAREAVVRAQWDDYYSANLVTVLLRDVRVLDLAGPAPAERVMERQEIGPYEVPASICDASEQINLEQLRAHPERYGLGASAAEMVEKLDRSVVGRMLAKISAEVHLRLAYGFSCMLLVMLGAALGLLFRGGQVLVAFAIAVVPASLVIVLLFMGKELIKNPGVPPVYGICAMWGGLAALGAATAYVYLVHMRR